MAPPFCLLGRCLAELHEGIADDDLYIADHDGLVVDQVLFEAGLQALLDRDRQRQVVRQKVEIT